MNKPLHFYSRQKGFSLLETLVSFTVLTLVITVIFQIYTNGTRSTMLSYEYTRAIVIAQSELAAFQLSHSNLSGNADKRYQWEIEKEPTVFQDITSTNEGNSSFLSYIIKITVSWVSAGKQRQVKLRSVRLTNKQ